MWRHIHAFVFWAGNLRSHLTRHHLTEEKVSVQTGIECVLVCVHLRVLLPVQGR